MKNIYILFSTFLLAQIVTAQHAAFMESGRITYERKVNTFAAMKIFLSETKQVPEDQIPDFMVKYRQGAPQFWTDSFQLFFDSSHTLYEPVNRDIGFSETFQIPAAYKNRVYSNFQTREATTEKVIFDKNFFIKDSVKNIKWKLTDETRDILGYQCRRANALFFDSIYVVAFYTDEIMTKGGPESYNGLPGMILGIAVPHQHITIFATSVTGFETSQQKWKLPVQGKSTPVNNREFTVASSKLLKDFNLTSPWVQFFMDM